MKVDGEFLEIVDTAIKCEDYALVFGSKKQIQRTPPKNRPDQLGNEEDNSPEEEKPNNGGSYTQMWKQSKEEYEMLEEQEDVDMPYQHDF